MLKNGSISGLEELGEQGSRPSKFRYLTIWLWQQIRENDYISIFEAPPQMGRPIKLDFLRKLFLA